MGSRHVHRGDAAVRRSGDVEFPTFDLVVGEDLLQEVGEDPVATFEEQLTVWRGWRHHDVSALLGFRPEVSVQHTIDGVHRLRAAAERNDPRVRLRRVVAIRQNHFVMDRDATHGHRLFLHVGSRGQGERHQRNHDGCCQSAHEERHGHRGILLARF